MRHLLFLFFFSVGFGLNFRGGVSACPKRPQGVQRKMRTPAFETLKLSRPAQNPHNPLPIGLLKRLALSFTSALPP